MTCRRFSGSPTREQSSCTRSSRQYGRSIGLDLSQVAASQPLAFDPRITEAARLHSQDMADSSNFSHRGSDGSMVDDRADKLGISNWSAIGENIAYLRGFDDVAASAIEKWLESPSHKKNLLDKRWKETGIGVAVLSDGTYYLTQVFLLRD